MKISGEEKFHKIVYRINNEIREREREKDGGRRMGVIKLYFTFSKS